VGVGGVFPGGATVTNVTADCLHGTVGGGRARDCFCKRGRTGKSRSSNRGTDMQLFESLVSARGAIGYGNVEIRSNRG
jgi:hypothetical protein